MKKKINKHWDYFVLGLILLIIFATNFTPGTYLAGWDNLLPELNIFLNLKRSFLAVWQEYQGLGLVGGMGHATDLVRQIILLPFILLLPNSWIRYLWHFAMLALGTFGILTLGKKTFKFKRSVAFLTALFYLLNFGTIQLFWAPYESFTSFWGFFPWLILSFYQLLKNKDRSSWVKFILINFLAIPSFYLQTIFFIYFLCLIPLSVITILKRPKEKVLIIKAFFTLFLINSFWLLPTTYFLITNRHHPQQALINQMSSQETFLRNQKRGTIKDLLLLRGYYYDFPDREQPLMIPWQNHFSQNTFLVFGYFLGSLAITGILIFLFKLLKKKREKARQELLGTLFIFLIVCFALLSATPPFSWLNKVLRSYPFLNQALRSPFTKFIVPVTFSFSIFFGLALKEIVKKLNSRIIVLLLTAVFLIYSSPVFKGNFIYPKMRVSIPTEYFETFAFLKNESKTARIANLPQGSFWGWTSYRWGLRGSGFIWYAIEQPILDRAFDVWSLKNGKYWEDLNYALQNQNQKELEAVLSKYQVELVIFDDHLTFPGEKIYAKQALNTKLLLEKSSRLKKVASFGEIDIYRFDSTTNPYLTKSPNRQLTLDFNSYEMVFPNEENKKLFLPNPISTDWFPTHFIRCNKSLGGERDLQEIVENNEMIIRLTSEHDDACATWWFGELPLNLGWLVEIEYRNLQGHPLIFSGWNEEANLKFFQKKGEKNDDWRFSRFIIPPYQQEKSGITIAASSISYNQFKSINDIKKVKLYPLKFREQPDERINTDLSLKSKSNLWHYTIKIPTNPNFNYLVLPQSFDSGWFAFYLRGVKPIFLKNHLLINNWANGWELPEGQDEATVHIFFCPQILEFFGFGLLLITPIIILKTKGKKKID